MFRADQIVCCLGNVACNKTCKTPIKILNVAKCNLGKVKNIEASAGQRCPHGLDMRGRL